MANQIKLSAKPRTQAGAPGNRAARLDGYIPANIYGAGQPNQNLQIPARDFARILSHAVGEQLLVDLDIESASGTESRLALIKEVQHEPVSGRVLHVDFHAVKANEKVSAKVVVEPIGEPTGVKNFGGLLEQSLREIEIECFPRDLPNVITVDVSALNVGDAIHVRDIALPEGVVATDDADLTVFLVASPTVAVEPASGAEPQAQPEVIKEKKEDASAGDAKK